MRSETTMSLIMRVNLIVKYLIVTMRFFAMGSPLIMRLIVGPVQRPVCDRQKLVVDNSLVDQVFGYVVLHIGLEK